MQDFISEIRKINTDGLIWEFSKLSIEMFRNNQYYKDIEISVVRHGLLQKQHVRLSAWDIPNIEYLSILHSNDYRRAKKVPSIGVLVNSYRGYDNAHSVADQIKDAEISTVFRAIMGMTAEQFQYESTAWIFEKLNRDYYILHAAQHFEHRSEINLNAIVESTFGYSVDDYVAVLLLVFGLCGQTPIPLAVLDKIKSKFESTVLTKENITNLIQYYSCSYDELRESPLKKQLLYSKPFIKIKRDKTYMASNLFLVAMTVANGMYWLVRDFYCKQGSQKFVNTFGLLFEDYIKDMASIYCAMDKWKVLSPGKKKGADFLFNFGPVNMIVESKTALLRLDAKQQVPNLGSVDSFFERTIKESYEQLQSSYEQLEKNTAQPIIKVILLYDEFSNTAIIERSIDEIFERDPRCYIMTIREFEILLYLHCNNTAKCDAIFSVIVEHLEHGTPRENIGAIYEKLSIFENLHLENRMDFAAHLFKKFESHLEDVQG